MQEKNKGFPLCVQHEKKAMRIKENFIKNMKEHIQSFVNYSCMPGTTGKNLIRISAPFPPRENSNYNTCTANKKSLLTPLRKNRQKSEYIVHLNLNFSVYLLNSLNKKLLLYCEGEWIFITNTNLNSRTILFLIFNVYFHWFPTT